MTFRCGFCEREFLRERSLEVHMCETKRRNLERNERGVQLGLQAFLRFYETLQGSSKLKTWDDFVSSSYYRAFVKFGRYCVDINVLSPERFLDWLLRNNKKVDRWASDQIYTEYLLYYLPKENVRDAMSRAERWSQDWSEQSAAPAHDCLRYGNGNAICHAVVTGRLSAWILYNCESGREFLANLVQSQTHMIWPYIDSDVWARCFQDYPADQAWAEQTLASMGW